MMTDLERLEAVRKINAVFTRETNDEDGDKYLSQADYAMEAIDAALEFESPADSPIFRQFIEAVI
jgi:hypothetical protein